MCRLAGYVGQPILLEKLITQPAHSLLVQSYQPQEMTAGLMNADGFGIGWYRETQAFTYRNILPIWNDPNLESLSKYVCSGSILANVRSATPGLPVDLSNCQPFQAGRFLFLHNGFIQNFRNTLYRPIRDRLADRFYQGISGNTDSEHIFALFLHNLHLNEIEEITGEAIATALKFTLKDIQELALVKGITASLNLIVGDGSQLFACRYAIGAIAPSLYWQENISGVTVVSEPLDGNAQDWQAFSDASLLWVRREGDRWKSTTYQLD
jgi:ergothioneine biosynthesis protein EgtC